MSNLMVGSSLLQLIEEHAERTPDAAAILAPGCRPLTYGVLSRHVANVVTTLNALGIGRHDRVAMVMPDGPDMAVACLAIAAGATCAPLNPAFHAAEFEAHLARLRCGALLVPAGSTSPAVAVARARGIPVVELIPSPDGEAGLFTLCHGTADAHQSRDLTIGAAEPDDVALVLHTSGTAARPKVVPLTHRNVCEAAQNIRAALELTPGDRCLSVMPLFHIHGLSAVFASMAAGASVVCTGPFDTARFFEGIKAFQPTWYTAAPTIHREILDHASHHANVVAGSSLRFIRSASAAMPRQLIADLEQVLHVPFIEAYGMTEAAPQIASNRLSAGERKPGSVGRAAGPDVAIVDDAGNLLPPGRDGEVVIRGTNVMSGYADDPEANRRAFVHGWFRTGDRGHLDADGFLFITGRLKEIINRGGEKISPHEVDEVLLDHPAVAQAVTFPVPHPTLGEDIAAAIVLESSAPAALRDELVREIRDFASGRLADFKVPQLVVIVREIPTDAGGKVQRLDLAERLGLLTPGQVLPEFVAPRTALEESVSRAWDTVTGGTRRGVHDNFFQAGGDSLKAAQVLSRLSAEFQIDLPANALFHSPTVAELAAVITGQLARRGGVQSAPIPRRNASEPCPLSFAQQRLWVLDQLEPGNPAYNMHVALRLTGKISVEALEQSLGEILRRHDVLRTTFPTIGGQPVQVVSPAQPLHMPMVDLTRRARSVREAEARRLAFEEASRPFHLVHGPLFRALLLKLDADAHLLVLAMHHIVSDGWSTGVLLRELATLYAAYASGQPSPLPEPPIQYKDFAVWQRERLQGDMLEPQLTYWRAQLEGMPPVLELPADRSRPDIPTFRGASYAMDIPGELTARLNALAPRDGVSPFMTLLTAFHTLLHRYTGHTDLVVGTPIAGRTHVDMEGLVGLFANTLVIRADLSGNPSFREALRRMRTTAINAFEHQDLPFEKLVEALHPERDHRHNPLFQVMFAYQNLPNDGPEELFPGLSVSTVEVTKPTAKFDLTVYVTESGPGLSMTWQYNTDLFDESRIARMAGHFRTLLDAIVAAPEAALSDLPLLTDSERHELLTWNRTAMPAGGDRCFHHLFEEQARLHPEAAAVRCGDELLTYRELNVRANQLAARLRHMGVGPETRVGILVTRSAGVVVAVLAVMKAGGTFVPLDPAYPAEHVAFVLDDAKVAVVLTDESLADITGADGGQNPVSGASPSNLAYVLYTSGSTGKPKGVMITHANLSHYVHAMRATLGIGADDRYLHTASFAFSSSVRQLALPLSCGASVVLARSETIRDPQALFELITRERVSIIDLVPSHWRMCQQALAALSPDSRASLLTNQLRLVLSASEPLPSDLTKEWAVTFGHGARLINMFGQTETAGIVTTYPIPSGAAKSTRIVPIGRPIPNTQAYVLDPVRQPVPIGVWGELYIGGAGVGRGYLNDPELTAERFVPDPFNASAGARLYRTGDVVRYLPNGDLEFSGRVDQQMKVRGYRIEPGQIEAVVAQHPAWRESAVATEEGTGGKRLVAYVVRSAQLPASTRELRSFLKQKLPDYMIPSRIVELPALPRTPNGKVNWAALTAGAVGDASLPSEAEEVVPPTSIEETLTAIWADVLSMTRVSRDDNFFDVGGNSILAMQMITRANAAGLRLTPKQLWTHQTVAELATVAGRPSAPEVVSAPSARREPQVRVEPDAPTRVRVTAQSLRAYGREALERAGLAPDGAAIVTEVQLEASLRDQPTHNMVSIPRYAQRISAGTINPRPVIRIENETGISAQVDGDNGPGQWVAVVAMETAIRIAREKGAGMVAVRRSNHLGAAGHYPWLAAREGLIGVCTTTGPVILAPTGGTTPTFGNNPLGVGIPAKCHHPILLDIAMSVAPRGRIGLALAEGKPLPAGWILDRQGRPSTDPADLVAGLGMPIGGHKGYGLTLIMEVLAGVLTGAGFGWDNRREHNRNMVKPANFGHFFMAIDPELFMASPEFTSRVDRLIEQTKAGELAEGAEEILLPGESELRAREQSLKEGVPLRPSTYQALLKYGAKAGLDTELALVTRDHSG
jgi:amino acid adenylation domain-containing protein